MTDDHRLARGGGRRPPRSSSEPGLQRIWLAIHARDWRSLALVPASEGVSTLELAQDLIDVGWEHRGLPIGLADLRRLTLSFIDSAIEDVRGHVLGGERVVMALASVFESPASVAVAKWADGVVLCVALGSTKIASAERTLAEIGRERVFGIVVLRSGSTSSALAVRR